MNTRNNGFKSIQRITPIADLHYHAGMINIERRRYDLAEKHLKIALELNPEFHPIYAKMALDAIKTLRENSRKALHRSEALAN